ncbi:MAG TPA: acyl-CoA dehydrogenase family protein [Candidatus Binatia bacterium]|nr:acyl-CoA dehydrogenase family protein [Candidatus Binatia bacterium]
MDFTPSPRVEELRRRIVEFMERHVYPAEAAALEEARLVRAGVPYPPTVVEMRRRAKAEGLWNLFLPDAEYGAGLANWEYGMLCELMGRSLLAPMAFNCAAPDTGNVEILAEFGTPEQKKRWLEPLLEGTIRSCFSMTEPEVAGSDPTLLRTRAVKDGDHWVIDGHKWFTSGAVGASVAIVMAVTDPDAAPHLRASMILVPTDAPGFNLVRSVPVMGHTEGGGHCEVRYEACRVPLASTLGPEGAGFVIAQARLGPGRIHHCMRAIGAAERALELMCRRANARVAFGGPLAEKQFVQDMIATSRMEIDQARLLTLYAAWKMDTVGKKEARQEISMIKVVAANVCMRVLDRAIQVHGALGVSDDTPLARMWRDLRMLRLADGPDEVHKSVIARRELQRFR